MPRPRLSRVLLVVRALMLSGATVMLAACAPDDPLETSIAADSYNELLRWQKKHVLPLGDPIAREFDEALLIIARKTSGYRAPATPADYRSTANPLCRRLDGRSLRRVLVEGYELTNDTIRDRMYIERLNCERLRLRMNDEGTDLNRAIEREETMIRYWEDRLRRNEARLRELRGPAS